MLNTFAKVILKMKCISTKLWNLDWKTLSFSMRSQFLPEKYQWWANIQIVTSSWLLACNSLRFNSSSVPAPLSLLRESHSSWCNLSHCQIHLFQDFLHITPSCTLLILAVSPRPYPKAGSLPSLTTSPFSSPFPS